MLPLPPPLLQPEQPPCSLPVPPAQPAAMMLAACRCGDGNAAGGTEELIQSQAMAEIRGGVGVWRRRRKRFRSHPQTTDYGGEIFDVGYSEGYSISSDIEKLMCFEDTAKSVVFSKGLTLTAGQTSRMNHHVLTRGLGLGHVFVHTITVTDVKHNGLRIPKEISSVLNISETGKANLIYGYDWNNCEASYYTCRDERICFRTGWLQFASQHKLGDGSVVLILFHKDNADRLCVSFDRL